jgi:hypothetical protein
MKGKRHIKSFNEATENLNSNYSTSDKIIISTIASSISSINTHNVEKGIITIGKWTKLEGGTFSIWKSIKPIFEILNTEELYNFMLGKRVQIEKERFDDGFENIQ